MRKKRLWRLSQLRGLQSLEPRKKVAPSSRPINFKTPASGPGGPISIANLSAHGKPDAWLAVDKYIAVRAASQIEGGPRYARFKMSAGDLVFAGMRHVEGFTLALVKRGDDVLVVPLDAASEGVAKDLGIGTAIAVKMGRQMKATRGRRW